MKSSDGVPEEILRCPPRVMPIVWVRNGRISGQRQRRASAQPDPSSDRLTARTDRCAGHRCVISAVSLGTSGLIVVTVWRLLLALDEARSSRRRWTKTGVAFEYPFMNDTSCASSAEESPEILEQSYDMDCLMRSAHPQVDDGAGVRDWKSETAASWTSNRRKCLKSCFLYRSR